MALVQEFEYLKPGTLGEAVRALQQYGAGAHVLAGGTDLVSWMTDGLAEPSALVDIKGIAGLDRLHVEGGVLFIGALTTFSDLLASEAVAQQAPLLREMAGRVASNGIRNRATAVGNICSAVPCTDAGASLLVYDTQVRLKSAAAERRLALTDWFLGPRKTARQAGEMVVGLEVNLPGTPSGACWVKLGRYRGEDLAQASVSVLALEGNSYRVSFGSVAPTPVRGRRIEGLLQGKPLSDALIRDAQALVKEEIAPISDIRSSKEYRLHMVEIMLGRALRTAVDRLKGTGPSYGTSVI